VRKVQVQFKGILDFKLSASLDLPKRSEPEAYALFAHCFTCTKNLKAIHNINKALTAANIGILRFDFTGLGESEGDFAQTNFSSNVGDLISAAHFLGAHYEAPKILIGHSLGGAAVIQAAHSITSCRAVATIAAPYEPGHVAHLFVTKQEEINRTGEAEVKIAGTSFKITRQFLEDLQQKNVNQILGGLKKALLIFHAPHDSIVGIENAAKIFMAAKHPKSFISLDQADHLLMSEVDSIYVGKMVATWAGKYV
jgi:putative redox protein